MIGLVIAGVVAVAGYRSAKRIRAERRERQDMARRFVPRGPAVFYSSDAEWERYDAICVDPSKLFKPPPPSGPRPSLTVHNPADEALTREALRASREAIHQAELARQRRYRKFERGTLI